MFPIPTRPFSCFLIRTSSLHHFLFYHLALTWRFLKIGLKHTEAEAGVFVGRLQHLFFFNLLDVKGGNT